MRSTEDSRMGMNFFGEINKERKKEKENSTSNLYLKKKPTIKKDLSHSFRPTTPDNLSLVYFKRCIILLRGFAVRFLGAAHFEMF